jgi:hypothetical protein
VAAGAADPEEEAAVAEDGEEMLCAEFRIYREPTRCTLN